MIWFVVTAGVFNVAIGLINKTKNFASALIYKVIPFLTGLGCLLYAYGELM